MGSRDARVDAYIAKSADFARPILNQLRKQVHAACPGVEETMKWSFPHFMYKGMLCSMASFKNHCAFGFWKSSLLFGKEKAAARNKDVMGHYGRITSLSDLPPLKALQAHIRKAAKLNDDGVKIPVRKKPGEKKKLVIPPYFTAALKKNARARATFDNFSPSHQREYIEWITEAKSDETRQRRLATAIEWMTEGKSRNWKYARCT